MKGAPPPDTEAADPDGATEMPVSFIRRPKTAVDGPARALYPWLAAPQHEALQPRRSDLALPAAELLSSLLNHDLTARYAGQSLPILRIGRPCFFARRRRAILM